MHHTTDGLFDDCEFPMTMADMRSLLADRTLEVANGTESVAEAIERGGGDTFHTREDAELALLSGVGGAAVGRRKYSDRDPPHPGEEGPRPVSF